MMNLVFKKGGWPFFSFLQLINYLVELKAFSRKVKNTVLMGFQ